MTAPSITWLHLSDLHRGGKEARDWPTVQAAFERDLQHMSSRVLSPPDLVLFTGDLAFRGDPGEYRLVAELLGGPVLAFLAGTADDDLTLLVEVAEALLSPERDVQLRAPQLLALRLAAEQRAGPAAAPGGQALAKVLALPAFQDGRVGRSGFRVLTEPVHELLHRRRGSVGSVDELGGGTGMQGQGVGKLLEVQANRWQGRQLQPDPPRAPPATSISTPVT